ncbi:inositol monophosphatase family protein [Rhodoferax sp. TBRC 17660]|uniref:Inositol monophosphatase family protein n=1 Tax=Rhodoferax potami TaxID=3068338 RepID=A0ABU3KTD4_9BURK|nr:inositol monophosphatase family protein [Rhodoferax sp. TBRC 17660]MDT7520514.1 inositol monophosphatase family protein [Rhodoferax sp. TBRC 17660]
MNKPLSHSEDTLLLAQTAQAVHQTGQVLLQRFDTSARPADLPSLLAMIDANDEAATGHLRQLLQAIRPKANWLEDEKATGPLPVGEWWVVDPVEGNVNHIHGMGDWSVTATLVRDNEVVLTVVDEPLTFRVYTALRGHGAFLNGQPLQTSCKQDLRAALVSTGQATPDEDTSTRARLARSMAAMLEQALLVKTAVPATMQLVHVATGRLDAFWQSSNVLSGLVAGALLVREAGGVVTDWHGAPWTLASSDFVAAAPGLHTAAVKVLQQVA